MNNQQTAYKYRMAGPGDKHDNSWCGSCQKPMTSYYYIRDAELSKFILDNDLENVEVYICPCGKSDIVVYDDDDW